MSEQPNWLIDLVAAVERYEFVHPKVEDGDPECLAPALDAVPNDVRVAARAVDWYKRQAEKEDT